LPSYVVEYGVQELFHSMHAIELCEPIFKAMAECEADKPLLSRMMSMVNRLTEHANAFSAKPPLFSTTVGKDGQNVTLLQLVNKRLREFYYKPSMPAAFLLDPLNFEEPRPGQIALPFTPLTVQEVNDAVDDIDRLGGDQAVLELQRSRLVGFTGLDKMATAVIKECTIRHIQETNDSDANVVVPCVPQRIGVWRQLLAKQYPALARVAEQYLSMHATSCAAERNLSVWGRVYDKCRGSLKLDKAEKMVFLHFNGKLQLECDVGMSEPLLFEELIEDEAEQDVGEGIEQDVANESQMMHDNGHEQDILEELGNPVDKRRNAFFY
jgi:hypothetical protein